MKDINYYLRKELKQQTDILSKIEDRPLTDVEGHIEIRNSRGYVQYYHVKKNVDTKKFIKTYIPKKEIGFIKDLVNKHYLIKEKKIVLLRIKYLEALCKLYSKETDYVAARKELIDEIEPTYKQVLSAWLSKTSYSNPYHLENLRFFTRKGLKVRSKSEKILADMFDDMGLSYKYEELLYLDENTRIYPDFTFLNPVTYQEIYWEHFGMVDNADYARNMVQKLSLYSRFGIYPGNRLIISLETSVSELNFNELRAMIESFLK